MKIYVYKCSRSSNKIALRTVEVKETDKMYKRVSEGHLPSYRQTMNKDDIGKLNAEYSTFEMALLEQDKDAFVNAIIIHQKRQIETHLEKIKESTAWIDVLLMEELNGI